MLAAACLDLERVDKFIESLSDEFFIRVSIAAAAPAAAGVVYPLYPLDSSECCLFAFACNISSMTVPVPVVDTKSYGCDETPMAYDATLPSAALLSVL